MPPKTTMKSALKRPDPSAVSMVAAVRSADKRETTPEPVARAYAPDPFAAPMMAAARGAEPEIRPGYKMVKAREVLPHVSVYLHPKVIARFKEIAAVEGKKAHALYLEALDQYLTTNHGVTLESLSRE